MHPSNPCSTTDLVVVKFGADVIRERLEEILGVLQENRAGTGVFSVLEQTREVGEPLVAVQANEGCRVAEGRGEMVRVPGIKHDLLQTIEGEAPAPLEVQEEEREPREGAFAERALELLRLVGLLVLESCQVKH